MCQRCFVCCVDKERRYEEIHSVKIDALADIVEEANKQPLLVAYAYQSDKERIQKRFPNAVDVKQKGAVKKWNAGEIQMLLCHPASAGHGLNLQAGGHTAVWFGLTWSLEEYEQLNARLYRQGQEHPVVIHHLVMKDTIDETIVQALDRKEVTQNALLDALKTQIEGRE